MAVSVGSRRLRRAFSLLLWLLLCAWPSTYLAPFPSLLHFWGKAESSWSLGWGKGHGLGYSALRTEQRGSSQSISIGGAREKTRGRQLYSEEQWDEWQRAGHDSDAAQVVYFCLTRTAPLELVCDPAWEGLCATPSPACPLFKALFMRV